MSPATFARLQKALDYVLAQDGKMPAAAIIDALIRDHGASYSTTSSTNSLRCGGVQATCTWSRDTGLLAAWRKNAVNRTAMEAMSA